MDSERNVTVPAPHHSEETLSRRQFLINLTQDTIFLSALATGAAGVALAASRLRHVDIESGEALWDRFEMMQRKGRSWEYYLHQGTNFLKELHEFGLPKSIQKVSATVFLRYSRNPHEYRVYIDASPKTDVALTDYHKMRPNNTYDDIHDFLPVLKRGHVSGIVLEITSNPVLVPPFEQYAFPSPLDRLFSTQYTQWTEVTSITISPYDSYLLPYMQIRDSFRLLPYTDTQKQLQAVLGSNPLFVVTTQHDTKIPTKFSPHQTTGVGNLSTYGLGIPKYDVAQPLLHTIKQAFVAHRNDGK